MGIFTYVAISVMNEHQNSILPASSVATTTPENQCDIYTTDFYDTSKQPWKMLPACALVEKDDGGWCDDWSDNNEVHIIKTSYFLKKF